MNGHENDKNCLREKKAFETRGKSYLTTTFAFNVLITDKTVSSFTDRLLVATRSTVLVHADTMSIPGE